MSSHDYFIKGHVLKTIRGTTVLFVFVLHDKFKHFIQTVVMLWMQPQRCKLYTTAFHFHQLLFTGSVPLFNKKFKDFQGHISHFSRTPLSAKKSGLASMSFKSFHNMCNFFPKGLSVFASLLLQFLGWIKLAPKFMDFLAPTAIFKDFQGACKPFIQ